MAEQRGSAWYGQQLVASATCVMVTWLHELDDWIDRRERDDRLADERRWVHRLLVAARERAPATQTRRECAELLQTEERLWTFLSVEGMSPTSNLAERCLRRAVIWRRKALGRTPSGAAASWSGSCRPSRHSNYRGAMSSASSFTLARWPWPATRQCRSCRTRERSLPRMLQPSRNVLYEMRCNSNGQTDEAIYNRRGDVCPACCRCLP